MTGKRQPSAPQKGKAPKTMSAPVPGPPRYLGPSTIAAGPALERARLMIASKHNDYGASKLLLASELLQGRALTCYPFFFHTIFAGLVPPFSTFFLAVLDHYRVRPLHLHPNTILTLALFAFYCEAFLGVRPSVAFFRCFFSARRSGGSSGPGCLGFRIGGGLGDHFPPSGVPKKVDNLSG